MTEDRADEPKPHLPSPVLEIVARIQSAGHPAYVVGGCIRDSLRGVAVRDFDLATGASPAEILELFPRAVPTHPQHGTSMIPSSAGPVDVTPFRAGPDIAADLARRDFTLNALAFDPIAGRLLDPHEGRADLAAGCLRAVGSARERLAEDPVRGLRGARIAAELGLTPDAELLDAMGSSAGQIRQSARERIRIELLRLLDCEQPGSGIALLRATGFEAELLPGAEPDSASIIDALPKGMPIRLTAWLRGTRAGSLLARLRVPRRMSDRVLRMLSHHPLDRHLPSIRPTPLRRLLHRLGEEDFALLLRLRQGELFETPDPVALEALAKLEKTLEVVRADGALALQRQDLALRGDDVMAMLDRGPGPHIGRALEFLTQHILENPAHNTREALQKLLTDWQDPGKIASSRRK